MNNIIKDIYQEKNPQATSAPEEKTTPKRGELYPSNAWDRGWLGVGRGRRGKGDATPFPNRWLIEWVKWANSTKNMDNKQQWNAHWNRKRQNYIFYKTHTKWWGQYFFTGETSALLSCYKQHRCIQCKRFKFLKKPKKLTC